MVIHLLRESLEGGHVKGGVIRCRLQWLEEKKLPNAMEEILRRVSPETARILQNPILPVAWYPFRSIVETDRAIAAISGVPEEKETVLELGRYSARINLTASYRAYVRKDPQEFFKSVARLHAHFQDFGRAEYEQTAPTACRITMHDYPCYSKVFCWSALGYYEAATTLQGGKDVHVQETDCVCRGRKVCRFEIRWA